MRELIDRFMLYSQSLLEKSEEFGGGIRKTVVNSTVFLSLLVLLITGFISIAITISKDSEGDVVDDNLMVSPFEKLTKDLEKSDKKDNKAESFKILAENYNNFNSLFSEKELKLIEKWAEARAETAVPISVTELYENTTRDSEEQLYKFEGYVLKVDSDFIYGKYITFHSSEKGGDKVLIVRGISEIELGDQIEFYGVPELREVGEPMQVEAMTFLKGDVLDE